MNLRDSANGIKRRLKTVGILQWDHPNRFLIVVFEVECIDANGNLLTDKSINQSREVRYVLTNNKLVNASFNPVASGGTGEYDFFFNSMSTTLFPTLISNLATKLNERLIFD
jgi:hypothetical protein